MTDLFKIKDKEYFLNTLTDVLEPNFNGWKEEASQPEIAQRSEEILKTPAEQKNDDNEVKNEGEAI